ncbi:MAG: nickel/cobalt transporter [Gammaproteobacteria bacterium]|nr:nickel/cobalt transporter [Gammaproteobacteria bacterium]
MNHFSAALRGPHLEKLPRLFLLLLVVLLVFALYWHWSTIIAQVIEWQRVFHAKLGSHMNAVAKDAATYGWALIGLSFAYGVFHAVGPGHGKAVIATYLATHRESIGKGIGISMATALLQSIVAIALVSFLANILRLKFADIDNYGEDMALVSYVLIMILGLVLAASALRRLFHLRRSARETNHVAHHEHDHDHDHQHESAHAESNCGCQHAHVVTPGQSWMHTLAVIFSSGIRPCSGAIVVLIYAHLVGVFHYGVIATLVMGLGTGLSISAIALGSQYARHWLEGMMLTNSGGNHGSHNHAFLSISVRLAGGAILILLGWGLYQTALQTSLNHPLV